MEKRIRFTDDASVGLVRNFLDQLWMEIFEALRPGVEVRLTYSIEGVVGKAAPGRGEGGEEKPRCPYPGCEQEPNWGITCERCGRSFCAEHRDSHTCTGRESRIIQKECGVKGCDSPAWERSMFCLGHLSKLNRYTTPNAEETVLLPCLVSGCPGRGEHKCQEIREKP